MPQPPLVDGMPSNAQDGLDRREFLKTVGAAVLAAGALPAATPARTAAAVRRSSIAAFPDQPNILILITDQERNPQYWPGGWADANLPNRKRIADNGLSFRRAFCAASMCSPSRSTFFTGLYPEQHGVTETLSFGGTASVDQPELPLDIQNMAKLLKSAGYAVQYRGKWHMSKGADGNDPTPADLAAYGFDGWIPPDAGEDANPAHFGGGCPDNDQKYIEQAIQFLGSSAADGPTPWALVVSLVNPHDVLSYAQTWDQQDPNDPTCYNYKDQAPGCFEQGIGLPPTYGEDLRRNFKPTAHAQTLEFLAAGLGPLLPVRKDPEHYVNFYAYLQKFTDVQIGTLLDALDGTPGLVDKTVIFRFSDHGELGLSHGGLRQKMFNVYEEMFNVPLVVSNPVLFPQPVQTDALASLVDLMPTLATLAKVPDPTAWDFKGVDLMPVIQDASQNPTNPTAAVQDDILFTFDDKYAGAPNGQKIVQQPNHIRCIRDDRYKYAVYFDPSGVEEQQYELYDLLNDPYELHNMADPANTAYYDAAKTAQMAAKLKARMAAANLSPIPPLIFMPSVAKAPQT